MAHFEAMVQLLDVNESDAAAAIRNVDERLRNAGFNRWRLVSLAPPRVVMHTRHSPRQPNPPVPGYVAGGLWAAGVAVWSLWFLWLLAG